MVGPLYERMRIVNKYMGVHCTVYILNIITIVKSGGGEEVKGKGRVLS